MKGRKPTLGYPSRTMAVCALRRKGLTTSQIAARIGIEPKTVAALEASASRSTNRAVDKRTVVVPFETFEAFSPHAARRGLTKNELVRRILETVIDEQLVDAVLDDASFSEKVA